MVGRCRRLRTAVAVVLLTLLPLVAVVPATAADDAAESPGDELVSGLENSKAALVRIEVWATAEIAHIDHSTGDVNVIRARYEVPIRNATGAFTSSDGIITTTGAALRVTEDEVVVQAANRLFQEQMGTALVGNDGDLRRRAEAVEPYWQPHLHHCYDRVEHCVLFFVPHFTVFPHTQEPTSTPADAIPLPEGSGDVGLLRISGGGGTPTAELAPADDVVPEQAVVVGFSSRPEPAAPPSQFAVTVDGATGALLPEGDAAEAMTGEVTGGPVLDPETGRVVGLATTLDGQATLVPVQQVHAALAAVGQPARSSEFDAVFRRGIDHLGSGHSSAAAVTALGESLDYYGSALAAQYLAQAEQSTSADEAAGGSGSEEAGGLPGGPAVWIGGGLLAAILVGSALLLRRRLGGSGRPREAQGKEGGVPVPAPLHEQTTVVQREPDRVPTAGFPPAARPADPPGRPSPAGSVPPDAERTRLRQSPALLTESARPARTSPGFCSDCGDSLRDRARFCASCGSPVT